MKARAVALGLFLLLVAACLPVPFDLSLSQGAATTARMTRDNSSLLTGSQGFDPSASGYVFYPQVLAAGFDYTNGFVVSNTTNPGQAQMNISAVKMDPSSGKYARYAGFSPFSTSPDPHLPASYSWPVGTGTSYILGFTFDALNALGGNRYTVQLGNPGTQSMTMVDDSDMHNRIWPDWARDTWVLGASAGSDPGAAWDMVHWLGAHAGFPGDYLEFSYRVDQTGLNAPAVPRGVAWYPLPFLAAVSRCSYFYDDNQLGDPSRLPNRSFTSWWDDATGAWLTWAWWGPTGLPPVGSMQLPVNHRLDALLATGQLFSTEGGTGRLYDRDGNRLATFPLGNLVFIGEKYVGGVARCYFSQCLVYDHTLHFNVYWISTDQLATLGS